jgi:hypothetical protein
MRVVVTLLIDADGAIRLRSDRLLPPGEERLAFDALSKSGLPKDVKRAWLLDTDAGGQFLRLEPPGETPDQILKGVQERTAAARKASAPKPAARKADAPKPATQTKPKHD